jgi:hypothetical protein
MSNNIGWAQLIGYPTGMGGLIISDSQECWMGLPGIPCPTTLGGLSTSDNSQSSLSCSLLNPHNIAFTDSISPLQVYWITLSFQTHPHITLGITLHHPTFPTYVNQVCSDFFALYCFLLYSSQSSNVQPFNLYNT